ncbi:hypothetical protein DICPUDRAFT_75224 [Dictyostelium purpureum]|uniref:Endo-beta-1,2-glucanase SGL domain-containing protein n=1 Tax=Dictyostelium purpureum TaxID=5786 RepID=F0ZA14_DICPU|nr:uncharacterized protein DICPUDRAFT_75224 [Dictyostelium purpureum]EGC39213.1 hypothetical protein DICPUDRAFT_75224 [Dictyostelium purpureum]|eukprot:XP_003284240.1 hypothetical protein DICPUDRAFT_75224 [Dictyostelium purpureum]
MYKILFIFFSLIILVNCQSTCRFAPTYTLNDILYNNNQSFINDIIYWEGNFHQDGAGINFACGYTYDGHALNYTTGELANPLHNFSAPSKESIHLGLLARSLYEFINVNEQDYQAINFFHQNVERTPIEKSLIKPSGNSNFDNVITILYRKIQTYENFNKNFPGYGGFHPWVSVTDSGISPIEGYWTGRVPGLDNGEMIWSLYATFNLLTSESYYQTNYPDLGSRYQNYFQLLIDNAMMMFYNTSINYISSVTSIKDIYAQPTPSNYQNDGGYLDDPYEGETLAVFMDLFCQWENEDQREQMWINKRGLLKSIEFSTPKGNITVQKGWWFSSHEQWKYLLLPYDKVEINRRVFLNGERARTWFSFINSYPGLFASVTNVSEPNSSPNYVSATGIQEIAFEQVLTNSLITPYGSFPLFLTNEPSLGLSWYYTMLKGNAMQNPYGSTESTNIEGDEISPVITWDSKITTVLSMLGGVSEINYNYLQLNSNFSRFYDIINREWSLAFPQLNGESLPFMYPNNEIPTNDKLKDFTSCQ